MRQLEDAQSVGAQINALAVGTPLGLRPVRVRYFSPLSGAPFGRVAAHSHTALHTLAHTCAHCGQEDVRSPPTCVCVRAGCVCVSALESRWTSERRQTDKSKQGWLPWLARLQQA